MKRINMLTDPRIAALYKHTPSTSVEEFKLFLKTYPYQHVTFNGIDWAYIITQPRPDTRSEQSSLLVLSGALCAPEVSWQTISRLAAKYQVIAPEYPPVRSMDELCDGIAAILRQEGARRVHVLGGSYGGFVAQIFVRLYPETARSLALSHTLPPDPKSGKSVMKMLRWMALLPEGAMRWLLGRRLSGLLPEKSPKTALLYAIFQEMLNYRLTKADLMGILWRTVDFTRRDFTPVDLVDWPGKILLVLADDDPGTPTEVRARLQALYPDAALHLFHGSGHATSLVKQEEYLAVIDEFIQAAPPEPAGGALAR